MSINSSRQLHLTPETTQHANVRAESVENEALGLLVGLKKASDVSGDVLGLPVSARDSGVGGPGQDARRFVGGVRGSLAAPVQSYFQWPPCSAQTLPVLLHLLQVSLPNIPDARPPLQAWQS